VPFAHARIIKKDHTLKWWSFVYGPLLFSRPAAAESEIANVPKYAVMQEEDDLTPSSPETLAEEPLPAAAHGSEKSPAVAEAQLDYKELMARGQERFHAKLRRGRGPLAWAMRTLHDNPMGSGEIYELHNIKRLLKRLPATITVGLLYGLHYDIHAAQSGVHGTPEGARMERVYSHATKYKDEVEYTYSFVQILTACTASFAHGANDIGNSVGPWAVLYSSWRTGIAGESKADVPVWQLAVMAIMISIGLITYGYNIMKGKPRSLLYLNQANSHSHGQQDHLPLPEQRMLHGTWRGHHRPCVLAV
jgi:sodium-dependent phosphate transporter